MEEQPKFRRTDSQCRLEKMPGAKRLVEELTFESLNLTVRRYKPRKNYCESKADIGKLIPTTITRPSERIRQIRPNKSGKKRGDKQDMRDMDVSFIRLKSATSRTITDACWNCGEFREDPAVSLVEFTRGGAGRRTSVSIRVPRLWMWDPMPGTVRFLRMAMGLVWWRVAAVLNGLYRHSQRGSASPQDLFGVKLSLGSVNQLRQEASGAVGGWRRRRRTCSSKASWMETSFVQATKMVTIRSSTRLVVGDGDPVGDYFHVWLSRSPATAQSLLGQRV